MFSTSIQKETMTAFRREHVVRSTTIAWRAIPIFTLKYVAIIVNDDAQSRWSLLKHTSK